MAGQTESGLPIEPVYDSFGAGRLRSGHRARAARRLPLHPRRVSDHVHRPVVDHAPVRRIWQCGTVESPLPATARGRDDGPVRRVRSAHPDGLRLRRSDGRRRGRQGWSRDRLDRRHAHAFRCDSARRGVDLDDDQRPGCSVVADVSAGGRRERHRRLGAARHGAKRHSEGVRRPRDLHLPAAGVTALHDRPLRVLQDRTASVEHDLGLWLSHGRGWRDSRPRGRLHPWPTRSSTSVQREPRAWRSTSLRRA